MSSRPVPVSSPVPISRPASSFRAGLRPILFWALLLVLLPAVAPASEAQEVTPTAVLESTLETMLAELRDQRAELKAEPTLIYDIVERVLVPRIDFPRAARWALGRHWREADREQRIAFVREFKTLLVRFYSTALVEYVNANELPEADIFRFLPARMGTDERDVMVRSEVRQPNGTAIPVHYQMWRGNAGWKVYDVMMEGISMVGSYRSTFDSEIREGGIDGLLGALRERNRALAANP